MGNSLRERVLMLLLPAFVAAAGYGLYFYRGAERAAAREQLRAATAAAVSPEAVAAERAKLAELQAEAARVDADLRILGERRLQLVRIGAVSPAARTDALRRLSRMLWDRGLYPYEESPAQGTDGEAAQAFGEIVRRLGANSAGANFDNSTAHLWQVRFYGRYGDVVSTLALLRDSDLPIIPVGITMSEAPGETTWRSWVLLLWI